MLSYVMLRDNLLLCWGIPMMTFKTYAGTICDCMSCVNAYDYAGTGVVLGCCLWMIIDMLLLLCDGKLFVFAYVGVCC